MNSLKESAKVLGKDFEGWSPLLVEESRNAGDNAHVGPDLRGAGSIPAFLRIVHTVAGAILMPRPASSPAMRR